MRVLAPAKVNLFLRIVGRRADGYHLLDSLMIPVSLCDEIDLEVNGVVPQAQPGKAQPLPIVVTCDDPTIPAGEANLAYRAAVLLCQEAQISAQISIRLHKRIPAGAGLGGGSSDAAAVLRSLSQQLSLGWTEPQLCALSARLGADVPFFIPCQPARIGGIGEILTVVPSPPARWLLIVVPPFSISTPWVYSRFDELCSAELPSAPVIATPVAVWSQPEWGVNDLERAVLPIYPSIGQIKDQLRRCGAEVALMSGSGSAVYGVFHERVVAEQALVPLKEYGKTFLVEPLTGPPVDFPC